MTRRREGRRLRMSAVMEYGGGSVYVSGFNTRCDKSICFDNIIKIGFYNKKL
jgi:hypothetical protein